MLKFDQNKLYSKELISLFLMLKFDQRDGLSSLLSAKPIMKFSKKNVDRFLKLRTENTKCLHVSSLTQAHGVRLERIRFYFTRRFKTFPIFIASSIGSGLSFMTVISIL